MHSLIYPKHDDVFSANVRHSLNYSTEYDDDDDDEDDFYEFAEAIENDRAEFFFQVRMMCVELTVCLISFI